MAKLKDQMTRDLKVRGLAESTVRAYTRSVAEFFRDTKLKDPHAVTLDDILNYQLKCVETYKLQPSTVNLKVAALRFFCLTTLRKNWNPAHFPFMKKKRRVPIILSLDEIAKILNAMDDLQYRTIMLTIYCGGLRSSEAAQLRAQDIQSDRSVIHVEFGKGGKTRYTLLPPVLLYALRHYWKTNPLDKSKWLFPHEKDPSKPVGTHRLRRVFKQALKKSGVQREVTLHGLRHAFGSHLMDAGVNLRYIQVLLGHTRISTTMIYTIVREGKFKDLTSPVGTFGSQLHWLPTEAHQPQPAPRAESRPPAAPEGIDTAAPRVVSPIHSPKRVVNQEQSQPLPARTLKMKPVA